MCLFIVAIVPTPLWTAAFRATAERHRKAFVPLQNASLQRLLLPDEQVFLTTRGHCDCSSPLFGTRATRTQDERDRLAEEKRKAGWGERKIDDWLAATEPRDPSGVGGRRGEPTCGSWADFFDDALATSTRREAYIGLFGHTYQGGLEETVFDRIGRVRHPVDSLRCEFAFLDEDVVHEFRVIAKRPERRSVPDKFRPRR